MKRIKQVCTYVFHLIKFPMRAGTVNVNIREEDDERRVLEAVETKEFNANIVKSMTAS